MVPGVFVLDGEAEPFEVIEVFTDGIDLYRDKAFQVISRVSAVK